MRRLLIAGACLWVSIFVLVACTSQKEQDPKRMYDPKLDAQEQVRRAVEEAHRTGKNVLIQIGFNQCPWCVQMNRLLLENPELSKFVRDHFVWTHINCSKESKPKELLAEWGNPQQFGMPVFVVLDSNGNPRQVQPTADMEEGDGYNVESVKVFLERASFLSPSSAH